MRFEELLKEHRGVIERYVRFRLPNSADAEDVLQETYLAAYKKFETLKNKDSFKPWLISIAKNKCSDWFRLYKPEISIDSLEFEPVLSRFGITELQVSDTMNQLKNSDREILYMYFWEELSQKEIAARLNLPVGTVKSRLFTAKQNFKEKYPCASEGCHFMKRLPDFLPPYSIDKSELAPFSVIHEELPGMFVIPRKGETVTFGMYDMPSHKQNGVCELSVNGKITLYGIEGVSIQKKHRGTIINENSSIFAQLTDTHCKYLGGAYIDSDGNQKIITFLDPNFRNYYGIGEDNCGFPIHRIPEGHIAQTIEGLVIPAQVDISDVVGRFTITINNVSYDTVRIIDYQEGSQGKVLCEHYIDKNGRTILWRRFNKNDWAIERYKKPWTELLPNNETLTVNGNTYVHWYDCVTDYIF